MKAPRIAAYSIPALLIATIVVAGSMALSGSDTPVTENPVTEKGVQTTVNVGPLGESIAASGLPVVFSEDIKPTTDARANGLLLTSKERAITNFIANVGEKVEVTFHVDNTNRDSDNLVLVTIDAPDTLLMDIQKNGGSGTREVKLIGHNQFIMQVDRGEGHTFKLNVIPLNEGAHSFIMELHAVG